MNQIVVKPEGEGTLSAQLEARSAGWAESLPAHIPVERFKRVVETAIKNNPKLTAADRLSFWNACMRAANDGLLPDGRDGALVIYSSKKGGEWVDMVQWMPMVAGIRKKVRNSGEIETMDVNVVYARDHFEFELGDDPFIKHKPFMAGDPGPMVAVYSVVKLKSGEKSRDVMTRAQVEYVRDTYSKKDREGKFSPAWVKSFEEMAKKTCFRRHAKVLPMSSDLDDLLRRDDALYDMEGKSDKKLAPRTGPRSLESRLDALVSGPQAEASPPHDPDTGEIIENENSGTEALESAAGARLVENGAGASPPQVSAPDPTQTRPARANDAPANGPAVAQQGPEGATPRQGSTKGAEVGAPTAASASREASAAAEKPVGGGQRGPDAEARRKELLADLTRQGDEAAAKGSRDLDFWIDGLNGDEQALLSVAQQKAWKDIARRASN